jgi:hypothetical protein
MERKEQVAGFWQEGGGVGRDKKIWFTLYYIISQTHEKKETWSAVVHGCIKT